MDRQRARVHRPPLIPELIFYWWAGAESNCRSDTMSIVAALEKSGDGSGGAYHHTCLAEDPYCDIKIHPTMDTDFTNFLVVAEAVEVFGIKQRLSMEFETLARGYGLVEGLASNIASEIGSRIPIT